MGAAILDGAAIATQIRAELTERVRELKAAGVTPGLGTILVGDNPASAAYVRLKHQDCAEIGIESHGVHLPPSATRAPGTIPAVAHRSASVARACAAISR